MPSPVTQLQHLWIGRTRPISCRDGPLDTYPDLVDPQLALGARESAPTHLVGFRLVRVIQISSCVRLVVRNCDVSALDGHTGSCRLPGLRRPGRGDPASSVEVWSQRCGGCARSAHEWIGMVEGMDDVGMDF